MGSNEEEALKTEFLYLKNKGSSTELMAEGLFPKLSMFTNMSRSPVEVGFLI